jgi:hypothetical protein
MGRSCWSVLSRCLGDCIEGWVAGVPVGCKGAGISCRQGRRLVHCVGRRQLGAVRPRSVCIRSPRLLSPACTAGRSLTAAVVSHSCRRAMGFLSIVDSFDTGVLPRCPGVPLLIPCGEGGHEADAAAGRCARHHQVHDALACMPHVCPPCQQHRGELPRSTLGQQAALQQVKAPGHITGQPALRL